MLYVHSFPACTLHCFSALELQYQQRLLLDCFQCESSLSHTAWCEPTLAHSVLASAAPQPQFD